MDQEYGPNTASILNTEFVARANHIIGWEDAKIIEREAQRKARWIRESIWIRRRGRSVMNRDEGIYNLSHVYDPVIQEQINIKKSSGTGSGESFPPLISWIITTTTVLTKQIDLFYETVDKNVSFYLVLSSI